MASPTAPPSVDDRGRRGRFLGAKQAFLRAPRSGLQYARARGHIVGRAEGAFNPPARPQGLPPGQPPGLPWAAPWRLRSLRDLIRETQRKRRRPVHMHRRRLKRRAEGGWRPKKAHPKRLRRDKKGRGAEHLFGLRPSRSFVGDRSPPSLTLGRWGGERRSLRDLIRETIAEASSPMAPTIALSGGHKGGGGQKKPTRRRFAPIRREEVRGTSSASGLLARSLGFGGRPRKRWVAWVLRGTPLKHSMEQGFSLALPTGDDRGSVVAYGSDDRLKRRA